MMNPKLNSLGALENMRDGNTGEVGPRHHGKLSVLSRGQPQPHGTLQLKLKFEQ